MKKTLSILIMLTLFLNAHSQCIEKEKVRYGGDWDNYHYTYFCPTYEFSFGGSTLPKWNILNNPIDINQIASEIFSIKNKVESQILNYAGKALFQDLKFLSVQIVYPDSIEKFADRMPFCNLDSCRAKYFFFYDFKPVEFAVYHIGVAIDEESKIVNELDLPPKENYKKFDKSISLCKLGEIAAKFKKQIYPIDKVNLEYNEKTRCFYWVISQGVINETEGINKFNELIINASNLEDTSIRESIMIINY